MDDHDWLAQQFEAHRTHLRAVGYRMLGSVNEADDAVQEAWLRVSRASTGEVENMGGWLTTIVARICLDMLRTRSSRREEPIGARVTDPVASPAGGGDPEHEAELADSVGLALLVVLDTLAPAERLAFVLHDLFAMPFDEIAAIIGCSSAAARQSASRARRRVQHSNPTSGGDQARQREVVDAFLAASRGGDFDALLALLDPEVVLRSDAAAVATGAPGFVRGAPAVAETFAGRAQAARPARIDGVVGLAWAQGGVPRVVFDLTIADGRIVAIDILAELDELDVALVGRLTAMTQPAYELRAIGWVESPLVDREQAPRQGDEGAPDAWLVFDASVGEGIRDLRVGSEIVVLTWLDRARRDVLVVRPRDDPENPMLGVFSTRSPDRPNPIGLHTVQIVEVDGTRLRVRNLEALDGTPIVDVKPVLGPIGER